MFSLFIFSNSVSLGLLLLVNNAFAGVDHNYLTLKAATEIATQHNPGLAQMRARAEAMAAIPSQVGALPDPEISFSAANLPVNTFNTAQVDMTQIGPGISQAIPFPGKLALRSSAATFEAKAALENVTEARWWLLSNVKQVWWQIFYLDHALQVVKDNQLLL
ncbi:TolC family protein, partial [Nitrosomonas aestuarii]|uniref:TolC family protein n=1 Tax=Nitrosomonas aestuarii TaxID=52441 RepID=UPI000D3FAAF5